MDYPQQYGVGHTPYMPRPPPPELHAIIDKTAAYVAKNGTKFETTLIQRHLDDPRFNFLNPWDPFHGYYTNQKQYHASVFAQTIPQYPERPNNQTFSDFPQNFIQNPQNFSQYSEPPNNNFIGSYDVPQDDNSSLQKLSYKGAVSFKLQPKSKPLCESGHFDEEINEPDAKKPRVENEWTTAQVRQPFSLII